LVGITILSPTAGTPDGVQLVAVAHEPPFVLFQVLSAAKDAEADNKKNVNTKNLLIIESLKSVFNRVE
jgi:hypothetical protein